MPVDRPGLYVGSELELFSTVRNWKVYWARHVGPLLSGDVLEVGAGMGSNTRLLDNGGPGRWVCLEPDPELCQQMNRSLVEGPAARRYEVVTGTLSSIRGQLFDSIAYIDVLEHIEDDRDELVNAASLLRPGGRLVVLSPAHDRLFSPFDAAIGHFRRYDRQMLRAITPAALRMNSMRYLDCAGLLLSAANKLLLRQSMPSRSQLDFWDNWVVPISRILDPLVRYSIGKTIIAVWERTPHGQADST